MESTRGGSSQFKAAKCILDGECTNDDAEMDSAKHFSTASQILGQTQAEELTDAVSEKATTASSSVAKQDESIGSIAALIHLLYSDSAKVSAALVALYLNLDKDKKNCESIVAAGGCLALVQLLEKCLDKVIDRLPASDQVIEVDELAEPWILGKILYVIVRLTSQHVESRAVISAIGGMEAVVKIMKTFTKCQASQLVACLALRNLACCSIGRANAIEWDGIEALLTAIKNHFGSARICQAACGALFYIIEGSKENTELFISLGGVSAVAKIRTKWPNNEDVQSWVRNLAYLIASEMKALADEE
jgi:hypothetical protein